MVVNEIFLNARSRNVKRCNLPIHLYIHLVINFRKYTYENDTVCKSY